MSLLSLQCLSFSRASLLPCVSEHCSCWSFPCWTSIKNLNSSHWCCQRGTQIPWIVRISILPLVSSSSRRLALLRRARRRKLAQNIASASYLPVSASYVDCIASPGTLHLMCRI